MLAADIDGQWARVGVKDANGGPIHDGYSGAVSVIIPYGELAFRVED